MRRDEVHKNQTRTDTVQYDERSDGKKLNFRLKIPKIQATASNSLRHYPELELQSHDVNI